MSFTFIVPEGFQYVGAAILSTAILIQWQSSMVNRYRRKAGIKYPQMYAEKAETQASKDAHLFNCMQRAHQNTLENLPIVLISAVITGLKYPVPAAVLCGAFSVGRIGYTFGYLSGDPAQRVSIRRGSFIGTLGEVLLGLGAIWTVGNAVWDGL